MNTLPKLKSYRKALTIASSDSGGGAGIQADLKTFSALGCFGMSVISAITAQNTKGVQMIETVSPSLFEEQLNSILSDLTPDVIKIGLIASRDHLQLLCHILKDQDIPLVVDPVMIATSGDPLIHGKAIGYLKSHLIPLATLVTPNLYEAQMLMGYKISREKEMEETGRKLIGMGAKAALVKGGHLEGNFAKDCYVTENETRWLTREKTPTKNTHGTGCSLSSAIAAFIAQGNELETATIKAKEYITQAIIHGANYSIGKGHGPVHHFHSMWKEYEGSDNSYERNLS